MAVNFSHHANGCLARRTQRFNQPLAVGSHRRRQGTDRAARLGLGRSLRSFSVLFLGLAAAGIITAGCRPGEPAEDLTPTAADSPTPSASGSRSHADFYQDREAFQFVADFRESLHRKGTLKVDDFLRLQSLAQQYPQSEDIQNLLAQAIVVRQDWDGLVAHYRQRPDEKRDHDQMAGAYLKAHRYQEAWEFLQDVIAVHGDSEDRQWLLALAAFHSGRSDAAQRILDSLIPRSQESRLVEMLFLRGQLAQRAEDWAAAEQWYQKGRELAPEHIGLTVNLGQVFRQLGRDGEAVDLENQARQLQQDADQQEATQRLMAALAVSLEQSWAEKDLEQCLSIIERMEPHAEPEVLQVLDDYRREIARLSEQ